MLSGISLEHIVDIHGLLRNKEKRRTVSFGTFVTTQECYCDNNNNMVLMFSITSTFLHWLTFLVVYFSRVYLILPFSTGKFLYSQNLLIHFDHLFYFYFKSDAFCVSH